MRARGRARRPGRSSACTARARRAASTSSSARSDPATGSSPSSSCARPAARRRPGRRSRCRGRHGRAAVSRRAGWAPAWAASRSACRPCRRRRRRRRSRPARKVTAPLRGAGAAAAPRRRPAAAGARLERQRRPRPAGAVDRDWCSSPGARRAGAHRPGARDPAGFEGQVRPRSGLALRHGLIVPNAPGTIDSDYRGEVAVILLNLGSEPVTLRRGDRIAQLVVAPVARVEWEEVAALASSARGAGGFGSTGWADRSDGRPGRRTRVARWASTDSTQHASYHLELGGWDLSELLPAPSEAVVRTGSRSSSARCGRSRRGASCSARRSRPRTWSRSCAAASGGRARIAARRLRLAVVLGRHPVPGRAHLPQPDAAGPHRG